MLRRLLKGLALFLPAGIRASGRRWLLRPQIARTARLRPRRLIRLAENVTINDYCVLQTFENPIEIGQNTQLNPFTVIYGGSGVKIGKDVMIAPNVMIASGNHDFKQLDKPMRWAGGLTSGPIIIEDDVWIGAHCIVCDGVTIAQGCVIGAGAVVTKSTEAYGIYAGVPARKIGTRRPEALEQAE